MPTTPLGQVIRQLREDEPGTDGQLLARFIAQRDEAAFATLVRRHGPMIWGVCRRVVRSHHDAEDAFQAAFVVLARKAAAIRSREQLANWLYGVAYRTALKARDAALRRQARERQVALMPEPETVSPDLGHDWQPLLDEELSGLPEKYRVLIVLCYLEGRTRSQAARQLGVPEGTVAGRLARGRTLLAKRLARRGVVVSGATLAALIAAPADAPASVVAATIKAAATGVLSKPVAALTEGVLKAMFLSRVKIIGLMLVLVLGVSGLAAGALAYRASGAEAAPVTAAAVPPGERPAKPEAPVNAVQKDQDVKKDKPADELQAVIDQVLKAYGSEEKVRGLKTFTETLRYTNTDKKEVTEKRFIQVPDKYRIETRVKGESYEDVYLFAGEGFKRWRLHDSGKVEELRFGGLEHPPEYWIDTITYYGPRVVLRLKDDKYKKALLPLNTVPEQKVNGRPVVGVRLTPEKGPELKLCFDKETGYLLKEQSGNDKSVYTIFSDYKKFDDIPVAGKTAPNRALLYIPALELVEFKAVDKFDDNLFKQP